MPRKDDRYFVVNGRRWRKTDPHIPEKLRAALVKELMAARRLRDRLRVQDAKVALGERGEKWWEKASEEGNRHRLLAAMRALLRARPPISQSVHPTPLVSPAVHIGARCLPKRVNSRAMPPAPVK